jgi:hypothetical protein
MVGQTLALTAKVYVDVWTIVYMNVYCLLFALWSQQAKNGTNKTLDGIPHGVFLSLCFPSSINSSFLLLPPRQNNRLFEPMNIKIIQHTSSSSTSNLFHPVKVSLCQFLQNRGTAQTNPKSTVEIYSQGKSLTVKVQYKTPILL